MSLAAAFVLMFLILLPFALIGGILHRLRTKHPAYARALGGPSVDGIGPWSLGGMPWPSKRHPLPDDPVLRRLYWWLKAYIIVAMISGFLLSIASGRLPI